MPLSGGLFFSWTLPFVSANSLNILPAKGEFVACVAVNNRLEIAWSDAALTAGMTDAVAIEPPEICPGGNDVSPRPTLIRSRGPRSLHLRSAREWCRCRYQCLGWRKPRGQDI